MSKSERLQVIEAALLAAGRALSEEDLIALFAEDKDCPDESEIAGLLKDMDKACKGHSYELKKVASGYRLQIRSDFAKWMGRLWSEKAPVYSRVVLETLALIAYRQPLTRADVEAMRGSPVSTHTIRTLEEREWITIVGQKDAPGKPALYGTTPEFLDYFNLSELAELPPLRSAEQPELMESEGEQQANQ